MAAAGQDRYEELIQQDQAMSAFLDSFPSSKAAKLAELEGMQVAGRQQWSGRASVSDMPHLPFDESQASSTSAATATSS